MTASQNRSEAPARNLGLDLVRATEAAAIQAGRWMGLGYGKRSDIDESAARAMLAILNELPMDGYIAVGEGARTGGHSPLDSGEHVGNGHGAEMDLVVDPVDGTNLLIQGRAGAIAVAGAAPRGAMLAATPASYMEKIVVSRRVAQAMVPECLDAPVAWTLALVARVMGKDVRDLVVFVLDRPRHAELIDEIRFAGARVALRSEGDVAGAILAAMPDSGMDVLMGIGGVSEGVMAACAVRALEGCMFGRLAPQSQREADVVREAGLDTKRIVAVDELVSGDEVFFAATGITDGPLLNGVRYHGDRAETHSLVLRSETRTRRLVYAEHLLDGD